MNSAEDVSLFERIKERCNSDSHRFIDLSTTAHTGQIEAAALLELAERIATELTRQAPNHLILIYLDQCTTLIPVMWGCLAARLTALPLSMAANGGRPKPSDLAQLDNLLNNAGSVAVVIDEGSAGARSWIPNRGNVRWLSLSSLLMGTRCRDRSSTAKESNVIAYLLQTSGTTGLCKFAAFSGQAEIPSLSNGRRVMTIFPLGSANGIGFISALNSLSVYLPLREAMRQPGTILEAVDKHHLDTLLLPPVMVKGLLSYLKGRALNTPKRNLTSLNILEIGSSSIELGEAEELAKYLQSWGAQRPLVRLTYGLTETGRVAYGIFQGRDQHRHHTGIKIGPILPGIKVQILSNKSGEPGSIAVKSSSSFLGYLDSRTFTLKSLNSGKDWFQTGDLGLIENGELIISGRSKDIIIVNSRKICLASIERYIFELWPDLFEAIIACASPQEELVLFVSQSQKQAPQQQSELHRKTSDAVNSQFGLPVSHLIRVSGAEIPRTNTGKIRKIELLNIWLEESQKTESVLLASEQPTTIASRKSQLELLQELISKQVQIVEQANPDQPISSFGLDSLSLAQIIGMVEHQTGLTCRVEACSQNPSLRELAELFTSNDLVITGKNPEFSMVNNRILDQYPHREALIHKIQTENLQMGGEVVGPHQVIRCFNAQATGTPIAIIANISPEYMLLIAKDLADHPIYYGRLSITYKSDVGSRHYMASCYVDWLEACLPTDPPILIGHCIGGVIVRHIAQLLWARPHRPRLTMLMDWDPSIEEQMHPYPGEVFYHVYEWHWASDPNLKAKLKKMANSQTPRNTFYFATSNTGIPNYYMDINATIKILTEILNDYKLSGLLD